jgi:hypothetical protein
MKLIKQEEIESKIFTVRGLQVMLDTDLAILYQTETKFVNRAVKRNPLRFPEAFVFQLTDTEWKNLRFQLGTSSEHGGRRTLPFVFTEQGVAMLSAVLNTETSISASIQIMNAFVAMRKFLMNNASVFQRLDQLELRQLKTDEKLEQIFKALETGKPEPDKGIFFDGQVFDAHVFASELIKKATFEIILLDNYIDESTLTLLSKKSQTTKILLLTKNISKQLELDLKKVNDQYGNYELKEFKASHDRFLIIDRKELYHLGASLKDLGKKWFAFSKLDGTILTMIMEQLKTEVEI